MIRLLRLVVLLCLLLGGLSAATDTWNGSVSSSWSTGGNWSLSAPPTITDDAVFSGSPAVAITVAGATAKSISGPATITITNPGTLTVSGMISAGSIILNGGSLSNAIVECPLTGTSSGGTLTAVTIDTGALLDLATNSGAYTYITGGLTVNGAAHIGNAGGSTYGRIYWNSTQAIGGTGTITLGGSGNDQIAESDAGGQTLTVLSPLVIEGQDGAISAVGTSALINQGTIACSVANGTLNIVAGTLTNQGTISSQAAGATLAMSVGAWGNSSTMQALSGSVMSLTATGTGSNTGTISGSGASVAVTGGTWSTTPAGGLGVSGGTLSLGGAWSAPGGAIACSGTSTINLGGSFSASQALAVAYPVGTTTVNLTGTMANTPASLALGAGTGAWNLVGGTIIGGTLTGSGSDTLVGTNSGGTLNGLTINAGTVLDFSLVNGAYATVVNGLTVNGSVHLGNPGGSAWGRLYWTGTQQWGGSGDILFGGSGTDGIDESDSAQTLTLLFPLTIHGQTGAITVNGGSTLVNQGAISFTAAGASLNMSMGSATLVNQGTISGQGGGTGVTIATGSWSNSGTISVSGGATLDLTATGSGSNTGLISDANATLSVSGGTWSTTGAAGLSVAGGTLSLGGTWSAVAGAISTSGTTAAPSTLNLGGTFTTSQALLVGYTTGATTVNLTGTMDNTGGLTLSAATGPWRLLGGTINGGTITGTGSATLIGTNSGGTLNGVTLAASTVFDCSLINGANATIINGLTVNGSVHLGNPGGTAWGRLYWTGSQQWGGNGDILFGGSGTDGIDESDSAQTLTLLSPLTVHGLVGAINMSSGTLINQGTIACTQLGGGVTISVNTLTNASSGVIDCQGLGAGIAITSVTWNNSGVIEATSNSSLSLNGTGIGANASANAGTISSNASSLSVTGGSWSTTPAAGISASGGTLTLGGTWSAPAGAIVTSGTASVPMTLNLGGSFTTAQAMLVAYTVGETAVNLTGTMANATNSLVLDALTGPWYLRGGTIVGGTITSSSSAPLIMTNSGTSTLTGPITITTGSVLDGTQVNGANLYFSGNLTDNGTVLLGSANGASWGRLYWNGSQNLDGNGSIVFGGSTTSAIYENDAGQTLTIGNQLTIHGQDGTIQLSATSTLVNNGLIQCDVANGTFALSGGFTLVNNGHIISGTPSVSGDAINLALGSWSNTGTIADYAGDSVDFQSATPGTNSGTISNASGTLTMSGSWTSTTAVTLTGASTVNLGGTFTTAQAISLLAGCPVPATTVNITGTMNNAGGLALTAATGSWRLAGGTIAGGTISESGGSTLILTNGAGTLAGPITLAAGAVIDATEINGSSCTVTGGLTIDGTVLLGNASGGNWGRLYWTGSQTLGGSGSIVLGGTTTNGIYENDTGQTLTIGNQLLIHGQSGTINTSSTGTVDNAGTIQCDVANGSIVLNGAPTLTNTGSIISGAAGVAGATVTLTVGPWSNSGTILAEAGDSLVFNTALAAVGTNSGTLSASSGTFTLSGTWSSTPAMTITGSSTINIGGTFATAQALSLLAGCPVPATTVNITGAMNNAGGLALSAATGSWRLAGGTIAGGTISESGGSVLVLTNGAGTLAGPITLAAGAVIDATQINGSSCTVTGGLTIDGTVLLGNASGGNWGRLYWTGSQTLGGSGSILLGGTTTNGIYESDLGQTLTIASPLLIHGQSGTFNLANTSTLLNQGTIQCDVANGQFTFNSSCAVTNASGATMAGLASGDTFSFSVSSLTNQGTITIGQTAAESWTCHGNFIQQAGGILNLVLGGTAVANYDQFTVTSGTVTLGGTINLSTVGGYYPTAGTLFQIIPAPGTPGGSAASGNPDYSLTPGGSGLTAGFLDTGSPTVVVSATSPTGQAPIPFTLTFSEPVSPAPSPGNSFAVTNGTVASVSGLAGSTVYTAFVTPSINNGPVSLQVIAGATNNLDSAPNAASNILSVTYNLAPALAITVTPTPVSGIVTTVPTFTITSSATVTGLTAAGLNLQGATLGALSPSSATPTTSYTVPVTMSAGGTVNLQVLAGAVHDGLGGLNLATPVTAVTYVPGTQLVWSGAAADGNWNNAANWTGGVVPGAGADVIIPIGASFTLQVATANLHTIDLQGNLTIGGSGTLWVGTQTSNDNIITLNGGNLVLGGGTLESAVVALGSGGSFTATAASGNLQNVTIAANATFDMSQVPSSQALVTGTTFTVDGTVLIGAAGNANHAQLYWTGTETWGGSGAIVFGQSTSNYINTSSGVQLTIGSPLAIHGLAVQFSNVGSTLVTASNGGLATDAAGGSIYVQYGVWNNSGPITTVSGSTVTTYGSGSWTNTGAITGSSTVYNLGETFQSASAITFPAQNGNTINITGTLDLSDGQGVLTAANSPWYLVNGTLENGTLSSTNGFSGSLIATASSGTLQNVTIAPSTTFDMSQAPSSQALVTGTTFTVDGTVLIGAAANANHAQLYWTGTETWGGTGDIIFGQSTSNYINTSSGVQLTISSPLAIHGLAVQFSNVGSTLVTASSGGLATDAAGGSIYVQYGVWNNSGPITTVPGSTFTTYGNGSWTNTGTITGSSTIYNLGETFQSAAIVTFPVQTGNTINITGTLDLSDGHGVLTAANSPWYLVNGTLENGTLSSTNGFSGSLIATASSGTLLDVTIAPSTTFDMSQAPSSQALVTGTTFTVDGTVLIGAAANANHAQLYWTGTETWGGTGDIIFGQSTSNYINTSSGVQLTISSPLAIHGLAVQFSNVGSTLVTASSGGLATDAAGGSIYVQYGVWNNSGPITTVPGSTFTTYGNGSWTNTGTVTGSGTVYNLGESFSSATALTFSGTNGNTVFIDGTMANGATTLNAGTGPWYLAGGTISSGSVTASAPGGIIATASGGTLSGITLNGTLDLSQSANSSCTISGGLALNGTILIGATGNGNSGTLNWGGTQIWSGTGGQIIFGQSGSDQLTESGGTSLTIQSGISIHGLSINLNESGTTFITQGPFATDAAGSALNVTAATWTNSGAITTVNGSTVSINGNGSWTSSGLVSGSGTVYNLGANFPAATALTFNGINGNTVNIVGTLDDTLGATLTPTTGPWYLHGGTISAGTFTGSGANTLIGTSSGGTLHALTIGAGTTVDLGQISGTSCTITGGITVNGTIQIGSPTNGNYADLYWNGTQTWSGSGSGQIIFGSSSSNSLLAQAASTTLTLASPLLIHGASGEIYDNGNSCTLVNLGSIASDVAGGSLAIKFSSWSNQGAITIAQGSAQTWACTGTFSQTAGGTLNLAIGGLGDSSRLSITGAANLAGTINLTPIAGYAPVQGDAFTVISASTGVASTFATVTGPFSLSYLATSVVANAQDTTIPTVAVGAPAYTNLNPIPFTLTFSEAVSAPSAAGLSVTGGSVSSIRGGPIVYTALITPTLASGTLAPVSLSVIAGAAVNSGSVPNQASPAPVTAIYEIPPTITLLPVNGTVVAAAPTFTVTFSNPVTGLQAGGLSLTGATLLTVTPGPTTLTTAYVVTTSMAGGGTAQLKVLANAAVDQAGNPNAASATDSVNYDNAPPAIVSIMPALNSTVTSSPTFVITFSESVKGLAASALQLTGGTLGTITPDPATSTTSYSVTTAVAISGPVQLTVLSGAVLDGLGGTNASPASDSVTVNLAPPSLTGIAPATGPVGGGTSVILTGSNFDGGATVTVGGAGAAITANSPTSITVTTPASAVVGPVDVVVTNSDLQESTLSGAFTYVGGLPAITTVAPAAGPLAGSTAITLSGTNFYPGALVTIGGSAAQSVIVVSTTQITATTPAGGDGPAAVVVTNLDTQASAPASFDYLGAAPTITQVTPAAIALGGGSLTITGTNFYSGATVTVGGAPATVNALSATQITATAPVGADGPAAVVVTNPDGNATAPGSVVYQGPTPLITSIIPSSGPSSGGTAIAIGGGTFYSGATVTIGGALATVTNLTAAQISVTAPAGADGPANVVVTNPDGLASAAGTFTYTTAPPSISSLTPNSGTLAGNTSVAISGAFFVSGATVTVGGVAAPSVVFNSASSLTITTPPGNDGPASVVVTNPDTLTSAPASFDYLGTAPTLTLVAPATIALGGGTLTITGTSFYSGATVTVGGAPATVSGSSATQITATAPAGADGQSAVVVTNPDGQATAPGSVIYQGVAPVITAITPGSGPFTGSTVITIAGGTFYAGATVTVGGTPATVTGVSAAQVTATTPAGADGPANVVVTNPDGLASAAGTFTYTAAPPSIASLTPNAGLLAGGTPVAISGANFISGATVTVGGVSAPSVVFTSASSLTITTPPGNDGPAAVVVTNPDTLASAPASFDYLGAAPTITLVAPATIALGGGSLTITGTNFYSGATVTVGGAPATVTALSATQITATAQAGADGPAAVVVTNPDGNATAPGSVVYQGGVPAITTILPASGPITGGTPITITGGTFYAGATVTVGGTPVAVTASSATQISVTTPTGTIGSANVVVTNPDGLATPAASFLYTAPPPVIASLAPASGPQAGGTVITITGSNFLSGATVTVGGSPASNVTFNSAISLTATSPPGPAGTVNVVVTNPDSQSSAPSSFLYVAPPPSITAVTPNAGSTLGGTSVVISGANFTNPASVTFGATIAIVTANSPSALTVTAPAGAAGAVTVTVTNSDAQAASSLNAYTYATPPAITAITPANGSVVNSLPSFTITFSQPVTGLTAASLQLTGSAGAVLGTVTPAAGVPTSSYTVPVTLTADGGVDLTVPAGAAVNAAGIANPAGAGVAVTYDTTPPTITAIVPNGTATAASSIVFTVTASEALANLAGQVVNGTISSTAGGPLVYTITVAANGPGLVTLNVPIGDAVDLAGNPSTVAASASVIYQPNAPTVAVTPSGSTTNQSPIIFTLTFSAPVAGLGAGGLVVGNGTLGAISGGPAVYTVQVLPTATGLVTLQVAAGAAQDLAGNPNAASPVASVLYDNVPPSIALSISSPLPLSAASTTLTIAFSKPVVGFTAGAIALSNAALSGFTAVNASTYTATISPSAPATASIHLAIPAGAASDLAGNPSLAAALILAQQTSVASTTVATPVVATSPAGGTVYGALCPGTWNGLAQVQAFLAGKSDAQARGFVWDAVVQDFVQVPAQAPTGGWQPFQGVFLATRQPAAFDFNGSMATLDYELVLKPGWNFVGLPPLLDNGVELVSHAWVDLRLEDTSGNLLSGAQRSGLIDVGPWLWDGTSYSQVAVMQTGTGYWIDNASSPGVDLVLRRLSSAEIAGTAPILDTAHGSTQAAETGAAIGYHAHGTPPMPPGLGGSNHDSSTHGCGLGSGIGALLALSAIMLMRLCLRARRQG